MTRSTRKPPWNKPDAKGERRKTKHLTAAEKAKAKKRAQKAGRSYPNLVDNMAVARKKGRRADPTAGASKRSRKTDGRARSRLTDAKGHRRPAKDPKGGLTAAGREQYRRTEGAHLKPGVTKAVRDMTPQEMKRKGSWATRFYGRKKLPPLRDAQGRPTRFALSAHAWGEPVPRTERDARAIAERGRRLLARYKHAVGRAGARARG